MMRFPLRSLFAMCSTLLCVSAADTRLFLVVKQ